VARQASLARRWTLGIISQLAVIMIAVGFGYFLYRSEQAERARQAQVDQAETVSRSALFARGNLGEMLGLCRPGWSNIGFPYQEPVALAWTRRGLTAFFLQGSDGNSLRIVRCDASGVSRGPRVSHPLHEQLPAEAPPKDEQEASGSAWLHAVSEASSRSLEASEAAVELVQHPVTGRVLSRRWRAGAEGATATIEPADAPAFALLIEAGQLQPVGAKLPALQVQKRRDWTVETEAAFALLAGAMPKGARISELRFEPDEIEVRIQHPTPRGEHEAPAPYGDKSFDEYGIADSDWWYPRDEASFGCAAGVALETAHLQFLNAHRGERLAWAWFSCSTAYSNGRDGVWHLVPAGPS
jgi:hypothetical protein